MKITFCGHADFIGTEEYECRVLSFLEEKVGERSADMYLGNYGNFDRFAYDCCKKYQATHPNVLLVFVTPYLTAEYQKKYLNVQKMRYDVIFYPEIEKKPLKFAICYSNRYMVENADYVIAYVSHSFGGAYKTYRYAKRRGKEIFNLADFPE